MKNRVSSALTLSGTSLAFSLLLFTVIFSPSCSNLLLESESEAESDGHIISPGSSLSILDTAGGSHSLVTLDTSGDGKSDAADVDGDGGSDFELQYTASNYHADLNEDGYADAYLYRSSGGQLSFTSASNGRGSDVLLVLDNDSDFYGFSSDSDDAAEAVLPQSDATAPSSGGNLSASEVTESEATLSWSVAIDETADSSELSYQIYYSTTSDLSGLSADEILAATDTYVAYSAPFYSDEETTITKALESLEMGTEYFVTILARDPAGNAVAYEGTDFTTTNPFPVFNTDGVIDFSIDNSGDPASDSIADITLDFDIATDGDGETASNDLIYKVYYSTSDNIGTIETAESNGTLLEEITGISAAYSFAFDSEDLTQATDYWFNIIVVDGDGYQTAYSSVAGYTSGSAVTDPTYIWNLNDDDYLSSTSSSGEVEEQKSDTGSIGNTNDHLSSGDGAILFAGSGFESVIGADSQTLDHQSQFDGNYTVSVDFFTSSYPSDEINLMFMDGDDSDDSGAGSNVFALRLQSDGTLLAYLGNASDSSNPWIAAGTSSVIDGTWHTAYAVLEDDSWSLYIDGLLEAQVIDSAISEHCLRPSQLGSPGNVSFGLVWDGTSSAYIGTLDRASTFNSAMSKYDVLETHRYYHYNP